VPIGSAALQTYLMELCRRVEPSSQQARHLHEQGF
jgi:hypothetical protein